VNEPSSHTAIVNKNVRVKVGFVVKSVCEWLKYNRLNCDAREGICSCLVWTQFVMHVTEDGKRKLHSHFSTPITPMWSIYFEL